MANELHEMAMAASERNHAEAVRAHEQFRDFEKATNLAALQSGHLTLRMAMLINGGAAVSILAFLGSVASGDLNAAKTIARPLVWFALGVATAVSGLACAYLMSYCIIKSSDSKTLTWEYPFAIEGNKTSTWLRCVAVFHVLAIVAGLASIILFLVGMFDVRCAIMGLTAKF